MRRPACHALVPAAGSGARFAASADDADDTPKQYRVLGGKPLIWHSLSGLLAAPWIARVWVVLAQDDREWSARQNSWRWPDNGECKLGVLACGGPSRAASVANGLAQMPLDNDDWVLVHDAARPCLSAAALQKLYDLLYADPVGGLLAEPLADTLKRAGSESADNPRVNTTVPRELMWLAQTPQMFRYQLLRRALVDTQEVSDEAAAIEALGHAPRLIANGEHNPKITWRSDLKLAAAILRARADASNQST